ncbi:MAG TPA: serine/threonine-protein kinase [Candidatus Koribacter sp.]
MSRDRNVIQKVLDSLKSIGHFELTPLRETDTGACFKAFDASRRLAISIRTNWPSDYPNPDDVRQQLLTHARAAQSLEHDNIAKVIGCGELDGACFIVSNFVEGNTLRSNLWNSEHLNIWDMIDFARQSCLGLEFAHSRGLVHQALHPGNIVLEFDGSTKLLDIGLFRSQRPHVDPFHHSALYLAPEQLAGHGADRATNLYAIAIMLYEIAAGKQPFVGNTWEELEASSNEELPETIRVKPGTPPGINAAIMKALTRDRSARFQTGAELVTALEDYRKFGKPVSIPPPPRPPSPKVVPIDSAIAAAPAFVPTRNPYATAPELSGSLADPIPQPEVAPKFTEVGPEHLGLDSAQVEPDRPPKPSFWDSTLRKELAIAAARRAAKTTWHYTRKELKRIDPWVVALSILVIILGSFVSRTIIYSFWGSADDYRYQQPVPLIRPAPVPAQAAPPAQPVPTPEAVPATVAAAKPEVHHPGRRSAAPVVITPAPKPLPTSSFSGNTGSLVVTTIPAGARVVVDGRGDMVFNTPQAIPSLPPGVHTLTITKEGYAPATRPVQITSGAKSKITVQLDFPSGFLTVISNPSTAYILIDGVSTGHVTPSQVPVAPGTHTVTLRRMGYLEATDSFTIHSGEQQSRSVTLLESGSTPDIKVTAPAGSHRLFGNKVNGVRVTVHTNPAGATVLINGQSVTKPTPVDFGLNAGNYVMEIRLDGYLTLRKTITVEDGKPLTLDENLQH